MSSRPSSCVGTLILVVVALILIRFGLPGIWSLLAGIFSTALVAGLVIFLVLLAALGYFIARNLRKNKQQQAATPYAHVTRVQELYNTLSARLQRDAFSHEISAEEFLQSEILVGQNLNDVKMDLIRLKDFASVRSERDLSRQFQEYRKELQETKDPSVQKVVQENLKLLEEKRSRIAEAKEQIREKEASLDLIFHSLMRVEEDLKLGRPVKHLLPAEVYERFGLSAPRDKDRLPPLKEKSSGSE